MKYNKNAEKLNKSKTLASNSCNKINCFKLNYHRLINTWSACLGKQSNSKNYGISSRNELLQRIISNSPHKWWYQSLLWVNSVKGVQAKLNHFLWGVKCVALEFRLQISLSLRCKWKRFKEIKWFQMSQSSDKNLIISGIPTFFG